MKKIECQIADRIMKKIDDICDENGYTHAEFNRKAIEEYLDKSLFSNVNIVARALMDSKFRDEILTKKV